MPDATHTDDTVLEREANIHGLVLPLIAVDEEARWHPVGTAFVIVTFGPHKALLVTAGHNLRHIVRRDMRGPRASEIMTADFGAPRTVSITPRSKIYVVLETTAVTAVSELDPCWFSEETDVGLALASLPADGRATFTASLAIDTSPVREGTPVFAFGYSELRADFVRPPDYDRQDFAVALHKMLNCRSGRVLKNCPSGAGINKWPGFLVDIPFDSAMSGGPVLDMSGDMPIVRGLIGSDLSVSALDGSIGSGVQAFVSSLWPGLGVRLNVFIEAPSAQSPHKIERFFDLIRLGLIKDHGNSIAHFRIVPLENGERLQWFDNAVHLGDLKSG